MLTHRAWVHVQAVELTIKLHLTNMGVSTDEKLRLKASETLFYPFCIARRSAANMDHGDLHSFQFKYLPLWKLLLHLLIVNVSINGTKGLICWQNVEDLRIANVSCVPDFIHLLQV
jgi:hypothetical protein